MKADRVRGKTIFWTFKDGPMANKTFEHVFLKGGAVKYRVLDGGAKGKMTREKKYEVERVSADLYVVSYLGSSGFTLTAVLDYRTGRVIAFASNEKALVVQHGTFKVAQP